MRERLITLGGALLALLIVYMLFFEPPSAGPEPTRPVTTETGINGLYAIAEWLQRGGIPVFSLRERYSRLADAPEIPQPDGNILVMAMPFYSRPRDIETGELLSWVDRGNTLLILAALNDSPEWIFNAGSDLTTDLATIAALSFATVGDVDDDETPALLFDDGPAVYEYAILPKPAHPLMRGIATMVAVSDGATSVWDTYSRTLVIEAATMEIPGTPIVWQRFLGDGHVIVLGSGSMLTNRAIARADNRRFIANVVDRHLGAGGRVIFDDMHQGISWLYNPDTLFRDARLHATIGFVLAFWLIYIVGSSNRLRDPGRDARPLRLSEFIDATGAFISRHTDRSEAARWLFRTWFNDVRRHLGLPPNGEPVWQELEGVATLDPRLLDELRRLYGDVADSRRTDLVRVHRRIHSARKAIG